MQGRSLQRERSLLPPPNLPGLACSLSPERPRRIIAVRRDLPVAAFAEKSYLSYLPTPVSSRCQSSHKEQPPIVSPVCITSSGSLSSPHLPLPQLSSFALNMKAPEGAEYEHIVLECLGPQDELSRWTDMVASRCPLHFPAENREPLPPGLQFSSPRRTQARSLETTLPHPFWVAVKTRLVDRPGAKFLRSPSAAVHAGGWSCWVGA